MPDRQMSVPFADGLTVTPELQAAIKDKNFPEP
jgi:hypothetical protein